MMEECVDDPPKLADKYSTIWEGQFNCGMKDSARMLFLLARVVKGAVRYNVRGELNQSKYQNY